MSPNPKRARPTKGWRRYLAVVVAIYVVAAFAFVVPRIVDLGTVDIAALENGELSAAQTETLGMVRELNAYLISLATLMFGGLGWYLSQYRPTTSQVIRAMFFTTAGLLALAYWYAAHAYSRTAAELAQNALGLKPGYSRILYYFELEFIACATAGVLILLVFADAVTRGEPLASDSSD
jgi:hypothetical protein